MCETEEDFFKLQASCVVLENALLKLWGTEKHAAALIHCKEQYIELERLGFRLRMFL